MLARKILLIVFMSVSLLHTHAQDMATAQALIQEGIKLHDAGNYDSAIAKYRQALIADADNMNALYEMSYTFYISKQYDSCIVLCNELIALKAPEAILKNAYVNLGSVYDDLKQPDKSINTYNEGIKKFPDFYLLHFNKAVTLLFNNQTAKAKESLETAVSLNPMHPGSHYWLAMILATENRIPAIMAASMVCILENNTKRSEKAAVLVDSLLMQSNVQHDGNSNNITIFLPPSSGKKKENDFAFVEVGLSMMQVPAIEDTLKLDTHEKKFAYNYQMLSGLFENYKKYKGFYWNFYAPFFYEAKKKGYDDVIANLILQNANDGESVTWLADHKQDVDNFSEWLHNFSW